MGWLFMSSLNGHAGPREYLDAQFTHETGRGTACVLRSALVSLRTYYAAVEIRRPEAVRTVTAVVCLVKYNPRDREGYIFGYKDMGEEMGPCEATCPAAILDLLTSTESAHALDWRARCRAGLANRAAKPRLRGATIVFANPIAFADGRIFERLTVVLDPRAPRTVRFRSPDSPALYRVSGLKTRDYHLEV